MALWRSSQCEFGAHFAAQLWYQAQERHHSFALGQEAAHLAHCPARKVALKGDPARLVRSRSSGFWEAVFLRAGAVLCKSPLPDDRQLSYRGIKGRLAAYRKVVQALGSLGVCRLTGAMWLVADLCVAFCAGEGELQALRGLQEGPCEA